VIRKVHHPTVVLGSTQRTDIIEPARAAAHGVEVVRRRGGGGAVLLRPDDHLWIEAWVPRGDPLWDADVAGAAAWVGAWWSAALASLGAGDCTVHEGRAMPGQYGALVCFSGKGPGEVFTHDRKVMGVSQWRGKEGALFHTCAYTQWDPRPLVEIFDLPVSTQNELVTDLAEAAIGLDELNLVGGALTVLGEALLSSFTSWTPSRS
jgi:lipoate---protein ligase